MEGRVLIVKAHRALWPPNAPKPFVELRHVAGTSADLLGADPGTVT